MNGNEKFEMPKIEVILFLAEDVVTSSSTDVDPGDYDEF